MLPGGACAQLRDFGRRSSPHRRAARLPASQLCSVLRLEMDVSQQLAGALSPRTTATGGSLEFRPGTLRDANRERHVDVRDRRPRRSDTPRSGSPDFPSRETVGGGTHGLPRRSGTGTADHAAHRPGFRSDTQAPHVAPRRGVPGTGFAGMRVRIPVIARRRPARRPRRLMARPPTTPAATRPE